VTFASSVMATLDGDYRSVPGQNFAVISVVGPECPQKTDQFGLKISGVFATQEEAANYAKKLQQDDATCDRFVCSMYKWLLIPPDRSQIDNTHYVEEKLEEIMTKYRENQIQAAKLFEDRKKDMMAKPVAGSFIKPGDENSKYYNKPDEAPISHPGEVLEKLKKERPNAPLEELIVEADIIVANEIRERQKQRLLDKAAADAKAAAEASAESSKASAEAAPPGETVAAVEEATPMETDDTNKTSE